MKDLIFITGNQAKADYLAKWLGHPVSHQKIDLPEIQSLDAREVIEHKAREAYKITQKPVLVEDVSLSFNAFGGKLPGTYIKWFLTEVGNEGLIKMLHEFSDRTATAAIMYGLFDGTTMHIFDGLTEGVIAPEPRTAEGGDGWHGGLSWNSIFIPNGSDKTYGQMTDDELKPFSHRAKAIAKLATFLDTFER